MNEAIRVLIEQGEALLEGERLLALRKVQEDALFEEQLRERFVACVEELFPALKGFVNWECWHTPIMRDYGSLSWDSQALIRVEGLAPVRLLMRSEIPNGDEVKSWGPWRGRHSNRGPFEVLRYRLAEYEGTWYAQEDHPEMAFEELSVALARAREVGDTYGKVMEEVEGKKADLTPQPPSLTGQGEQEEDEGLPLETRLLECLVELVDVVVGERLKEHYELAG